MSFNIAFSHNLICKHIYNWTPISCFTKFCECEGVWVCDVQYSSIVQPNRQCLDQYCTRCRDLLLFISLKCFEMYVSLLKAIQHFDSLIHSINAVFHLFF